MEYEKGDILKIIREMKEIKEINNNIKELFDKIKKLNRVFDIFKIPKLNGQLDKLLREKENKKEIEKEYIFIKNNINGFEEKEKELLQKSNDYLLVKNSNQAEGEDRKGKLEELKKEIDELENIMIENIEKTNKKLGEEFYKNNINEYKADKKIKL